MWPVQFYAPEKYSRIECFVRGFIREVIGSGEMLILIEDAEPSEECQRFVHEAIRKAMGEKRPFHKAPAYLVNWEEAEKAIAIFSLTSCFQWKCYLYGTSDMTTLYNWEGAIFDIWTLSTSRAKKAGQILDWFKLKRIRGKKKGYRNG